MTWLIYLVTSKEFVERVMILIEHLVCSKKKILVSLQNFNYLVMPSYGYCILLQFYDKSPRRIHLTSLRSNRTSCVTDSLSLSVSSGN